MNINDNHQFPQSPLPNDFDFEDEPEMPSWLNGPSEADLPDSMDDWQLLDDEEENPFGFPSPRPQIEYYRFFTEEEQLPVIILIKIKD